MSSKKPDRKIFYITTVIAVAILAVTGFTVTNSIRAGMNRIQSEMNLQSPTPSPVPTPAPVQAKPAAVKKDNIPKTAETAVQKETSEKEKPQNFIMPAEGAVSVGFSGDALIYSPTFDDWRAHSGIDIDAAPDTQVKAALGGTVTKIYTDEMMGYTIEIDHGDGLVTRYSNLSEAELVKEGEAVTRGTIISGIGNSAAAEKNQNPHLHFEVICGGEKINPLSKFNSEIIMPDAGN